MARSNCRSLLRPEPGRRRRSEPPHPPALGRGASFDLGGSLPARHLQFASDDMKGRIAVDANPLTRPAATGTEVYARELARRLPAAAPDLEWVFYASRPAAAAPIDLTVLPP